MEYKCHPIYKYAIFMLLLFWILNMYLSFLNIKDKGIILHVTLASTFIIVILDYIIIDNHLFIFDIEEFEPTNQSLTLKNKNENKNKNKIDELDNIEETDLHLTKEETEYLNE